MSQAKHISVGIIGTGSCIPDVTVSRTFWQQFMGLMGRPDVPDGTGMLFPGCNAVHTFWMRCTIDVVYIDADGVVVEAKTMPPSKVDMPRKGVKSTLEIGEGQAAKLGITAGARLSFS